MPQRKKAKTEKSQARGSLGRSPEAQKKGQSRVETQASKVRRKAGRLEGIMDMPLEIVREVSGRMKHLWTLVRPDARVQDLPRITSPRPFEFVSCIKGASRVLEVKAVHVYLEVLLGEG